MVVCFQATCGSIILLDRGPCSRRCDQCDQKELRGRPMRHPSRQNHPPFFQALPQGIPPLGTPGQPWPPQGARHQLDPLWTSICLQYPPPQLGARHPLAPPKTSICLQFPPPQLGARHRLTPPRTSICLQFPPPQLGARHRLDPPKTSICLQFPDPEQGARHRVTRGRSGPFFVF